MEVACPADETFEDSRGYDSKIQTIGRIRDFLIGDIKSRHTIEELSSEFHINQTTLKNTFKTVYGRPIATYMKEYRIKRAMELLNQTDSSIAEIAHVVGYENQSKFTQAFKDIMGMLPKDYRNMM